MKVTVRCLVFNHAPYLRQCLDSLLSQQVNFDYEVLIHDDASTDDSQSIIREYEARFPDKVRPIYEQQNQFSLHNGAISRIMDEQTTGEYAAFCEGDDYWTDDHKLQKQVDFLDAHPEYSMIHTSYRFYYEETGQFVDNDDVRINACYPVCTPEIVLLDYRIKTATVMLRAVRGSDDFLYRQGYFLMGDTPLWFGLAKEGPVKFLPEVTAVYRKHHNSLTKQQNLSKSLRFTLNSYELRYYLSMKNDFSAVSKERFHSLYIQNLMRYLALQPDFKPLFPLQPNTCKEKGLYVLLKTHLLKPSLYMKNRLFKVLGPLKRALIRHQ